MAKPIKNTPTLEGKDAINFFERLKENKNKKVERTYLLSILEQAKQLKSILKTQ